MAIHEFWGNVPTIVICGVAAVLFWVYSRRRSRSRLPPGPRISLPVVGNMLSLGSDIRSTFREWREDYGDIFSLYIGERLVVVLNGYEAIQDALVNHGHVFSERPIVFMSEITCRSKGIMGTSKKGWSEKEIAMRTLHEFGIGSGSNIFEIGITEEVKNLLKIIDEERGHKIHLQEIINASVTNVLCAIVLGKRFEDDDPMYVEYLNRCREDLSATAILNFIPCLRYLPFDLFNRKRIAENTTYLEQEIIGPFVKRYASHIEENITTPTNYISAYLKEMRKRKKNKVSPSVQEDNLVKAIRELFTAGSEPTGATILWCVLFMVSYPDVQEKCVQEIESNVDKGRLPCLTDRKNLPYVEATIAEVFRCGSVYPIGVWHSVSQDVTFRGFDIPQGTTVFPVLDSVLMDPEIWTNPEEFTPERFLDEDGQFLDHEASIPFSVGPRACPGADLARMEVFLFITALIQQYQFRIPKGTKAPSMEPLSSSTYAPKAFRVQAVKRHL